MDALRALVHRFGYVGGERRETAWRRNERNDSRQ
jgi:hypothetical protein